MDRDEMQDLMAGYALGILETDEQDQARRLIETDPEARTLLAEFEYVTQGLAMSVEPVEMPAGSLERLRQKAGITAPTPAQVASDTPAPLRLVQPHPTETSAVPARADRQPEAGKIVPIRRSFWSGGRGVGLSYAAALVLFITTAVFGVLFLNTQSKVSDAERTQREFASVLAAPGLKVTELKSTAGTVAGSTRVYTDPATGRAYLVAQNLNALPDDKVYEAWFINANNQPVKAGLLGTGRGSDKEPIVYALDTRGNLQNSKVVAITIEKQGGSDTPSLPPVLAGQLT